MAHISVLYYFYCEEIAKLVAIACHFESGISPGILLCFWQSLVP